MFYVSVETHKAVLWMNAEIWRCPYCLHHQGDECHSETSVNSYQSTRRYNPEDSHLQETVNGMLLPVFVSMKVVQDRTFSCDCNCVTQAEINSVPGTIISECYIGTLQQLKALVLRVHPDMYPVFLPLDSAKPNAETSGCRDQRSLFSDLNRHNATETLLYLTSISFGNWRNLWEDITSRQTMKSRQRWRWGSVDKKRQTGWTPDRLRDCTGRTGDQLKSKLCKTTE
jgi:hypothetical protein